MNTKTRTSMKSSLSYFIFGLLFFNSILHATIYTSGEKNFTLANTPSTRSIIGNTLILGNTIECVTDYYYYNQHSYSIPSSLNNLNTSNCINDLTKNDNSHFIKYVDIDNNTTTFNSSSSTIQLPPTFKKIVWAGLFWQGHINNYSYQYYNDGWSISNDFTNNNIENTDANKVKIKIGTSTYVDIEADRLDWFDRTNGTTYSAIADITNLFVNITSDINITIANISTTIGLEPNLGNFGAWSLVIVYEEDENNVNSKLRNNSIYYGYKQVYNNNPNSITISDFLLPKNGTIDSQMAVFAGEGEYVYEPDTMSLDGVDLGNSTCTTDANTTSCSSNVFDAKLSPDIQREPFLTNNNGIDIDIFDTSAIMTAKRDANPNATSYTSTIVLDSDGDMYFPSMVSFTTELYKPRVCYYVEKIIDENNETIYENRAFTKEVDPNKNYTINFWIANMKKSATDTDLETAELTQVYVDMNDFNYTTNSTYMQNINSTSFSNLTDANDGDLGEWDTNKSTWRIGTGATSTQGGTLAPAINFDDNTSKVFVNLNGLFITDSNATNFDLTNFFNFKASFETSSITIDPNNALPMEQCVDLNTSGLIYRANPGQFNIEEKSIFSNYSSHDLPTQIVKKFGDFLVTSYDPNNLESLKDVSTIVAVELVDATDFNGNNEASLPALTPRVWVLFDNNNTVELDKNYIQYAIDNILTSDTILNLTNKITNPNDYFKVAKKNVAFRISYNNMDNYGSNPLVDKQNDGTWTILNWRTSWEGESCVVDMNNNPQDNDSVAGYCNDTGNNPNTLAECMECVYGKDTTYILSRDNFAIRPDRFKIDINSSLPLKAGVDYNITFGALNDSNESSLDYNETEGNSFTIDINDTKQDCKTGSFIPSISNSWSFQDGNSSLSSNYNEIGVVNLKIREINGGEFALVDKNDTYKNGTNRLIDPYDINLTFIPDHFNVSSSLSSSGNGFTYMSNDLNMSALLNINITAQTKNNSTTKNYNSVCYAQNIDINISHDNLNISPSGAITKIIYAEETNATTSGNVAINSDLNLTKLAGVFSTDNNGTASLRVKINFDRNQTVTTNPFRLSIRDINITDQNGTFGNQDLNQSSTFYYGRVHAPDQRFNNANGVAQVYYEVYCDDCNKTDFNIVGDESIDSINWFTNTLHVNNDGNVSSYKSNDGVTFNGTSDEFLNNTSNINNGIESLNIATSNTPHKDKISMTSSPWLVYSPTDFMVEFYGVGQWVGEGAQGKTVDLNISKRQNRRLDW